MELRERQLVVVLSNRLLKSVLELGDVDSDGLEHLSVVGGSDAPSVGITFEDVSLDEGLYPGLVSDDTTFLSDDGCGAAFDHTFGLN